MSKSRVSKKIRIKIVELACAHAMLMFMSRSLAQSSESLNAQFDEMLTSFDLALEANCIASTQFNGNAKPLSKDQLELLRMLYITGSQADYSGFEALYIPGTNQSNSNSFLNLLKPHQKGDQGILFAFQVPFDPQQTPYQDRVWSSDTALETPDVEVHIQRCRQLESGGVRGSSAMTFMAIHNGAWKIFPT
jgi:hypothetical protein